MLKVAQGQIFLFGAFFQEGRAMTNLYSRPPTFVKLAARSQNKGIK